LEESKVAQKIVSGTKAVGGFVADKANVVGDKISEKIDQNEKLAKARDTTKA